jgi:cyanate lyase
MAKRKPIHSRVKDRVDNRGLTHVDIAKKTGWHELRVCRLLTGKTKLTADDMEVFARLLDCDVGDLYRGLEAA